MSEVTLPPALDRTLKETNNRLREIRNILQNKGSAGVVYGFHINSLESDPADAVTYLGDAVGMTPAKMDFTNNVFNWGSWKDAFFLPKPCMLKYDGTVDYYLDPDDYSLREDGATASDVADETYEGNAMMEWGQDDCIIWYKIVPDDNDSKSCSVYIADHQEDEDFVCWPFINNQGKQVDHFYTPIYNGFYDGTRMRSISGKTPTTSLDATTERNYCRANGSSIWDTEVYCDNILITLLLILMGKSLDTQGVFGQGNSGGKQRGVLATGTGDTKGLFWGSSGNTSVVKVFGMENFWGNLNRRIGGLVAVRDTQKYKLTRGMEDGSSVNDYVVSTSESAYDGYIKGGELPHVSGYYVSAMEFDNNQWTPAVAGGSSSTYYCDALWTANGSDSAKYALLGGYSDNRESCGAFCFLLTSTVLQANWTISAAPSCKPLS